MKQMTACILISTLTSTAGCGALQGPFGVMTKPATPLYEQWKMPNSAEIDVKKALLECGEPSINRSIPIYEKALGLLSDDEQLNHSFLVQRCMESLGFRIPGMPSVSEYCTWDRHRHLEACQTDTVLYTPSTERRLSSWHCRIKTSYAYCTENAINPIACDKERDHRPPPLECQP
jgi:hypothetical protein